MEASMTRSLAELLILALTIHNDSFQADEGCEVTGEFSISITEAGKAACEQSGVPRWGPVVGLILDLGLGSEPDVEVLIERIEAAAK
jgi:hypothetical protein